ncbi:S8 family serine peptidase [Streptomyces sp. NPDC127098]|uniref:S8 family serine peptidase n=1 Tax=Streptomyces sp. NPDC127098 TaxID=3347137 RepID=UPI0036608AE5
MLRPAAQEVGRPAVALLAPQVTVKNAELDAAVAAAVAQGVFVVVAAGDDNDDAVNRSPAGAPSAFTVGASSIADELAYPSNYGGPVDLFAPGLNVESAWIGSSTMENTMSGTAQAAAHVAGLAAYLISTSKDITAANVGAAITALATKDALSDIPTGSSNLLAYNNAFGS